MDPVPDGKEIALAGASRVSHALTPDGRIAVVRPYPYEVLLLDKSLKIIRQWPGMPGIADSPPTLTKELGWQIEGQAYHVAVDPTGRLFVGLRMKTDDARAYFLDAYSPSGTFMTRIPTSDFGLDRLQFFVVGPQSVLICNQWEPYPQVWLVDLSAYLNGEGGKLLGELRPRNRSQQNDSRSGKF